MLWHNFGTRVYSSFFTNFGQRLQWCIAFLIIPHYAQPDQSKADVEWRCVRPCHLVVTRDSDHFPPMEDAESLWQREGGRVCTKREAGRRWQREQAWVVRRIVRSPKLPMFNLNRAGEFSSKACLFISMKVWIYCLSFIASERALFTNVSRRSKQNSDKGEIDKICHNLLEE